MACQPDICLSPEPIDPVALYAAFEARFGRSGAVVSFSGSVRDLAAGARVERLWLDWYPGVSEPSLEAIASEVAGRFDLNGLLIRHRCEGIEAGAPIVFVAAASTHRRAAFEAADCAMDLLKSRLAIWKREDLITATGEGLSRWIEPTEGDRADLSRWSHDA